jgi:hypothetical protein
MCILFWINRKTGRGFDRKDINELYHLIPDAWMNKSCFMNSPVPVFKFLGLGVKSVRFEGPDYVCKPNEFEILCWERTYNVTGEPKTYNHFTCGNGTGIVTYDPSGESNAVKYGFLESKRVFIL